MFSAGMYRSLMSSTATVDDYWLEIFDTTNDMYWLRLGETDMVIVSRYDLEALFERRLIK